MCIGKMGIIYTGYIYKITNVINNKVYIGQTRVSVEQRYYNHLRAAKNITPKTCKVKLYNAIRKYRSNNFEIETLKIVSYKYKKSLQKCLDKLERQFISKFKSDQDQFGYNMTRGGQYKRCDSVLQNEELSESILNAIYNRGSWNLNQINILSNYAEVILYNKRNKECGRVKIDIEDVNKVKSIKWYLYKCSRGVYAKTNNYNGLKMHNLILPPHDELIVIHLNNDGLDNRKQNLKLVSKIEKQQNLRIAKNNKSGYKGVWFCKDRNKWQAQITINNKTKSLGRFVTLEEAVAARKKAEEMYYNKIK